MSSPASQSRLSVDLGKNLVISRSVRQNPPRLQHSPSLPNIWFPPHSGPLPSQMTKNSRIRLQRPSTPPPNLVSQEMGTKPLSKAECISKGQSSECTRDTVIQATVDDGKDMAADKDNKQHDLDTLHSLLTPPLTPSSSIATRSESTGSRDTDTQATSSAEDADAESEASRFLLVSNVARIVHPDILRAAIVETLRDAKAKALSQGNSGIIPMKKMSSFIVEEAVKGVFVRCQESHGIIMLAFHDVRHARLAKTALATRLPGPLAECVGSGHLGDDANAWLDCRFVTAEELAKTIGTSPFLASTDGTFCLFVECDDQYSVKVGKGPCMSEVDGKSRSRLSDTDDDNGGCKLSMLKKYLESFGDLRYFTPAEFSFGKDKDKERARSFRVEYYDTREADVASAQVDGQVLFGMKFKVYCPEVLNATPERFFKKSPYSSAHQEKEATESSPQSDRARLKDANRILPPGQHSQTRERFSFDGSTVITVSEPDAPHNSSPTTFPPTRGHDAASPACFYTSNPSSAFIPAMRESTIYQSAADTDYVATNAETLNLARVDPEGAQFQNAEGSAHDFRYWNGDYQNGAYSCYYPRPDCFYCPSQRELAHNSHGPPPLSLSGFYPPIQSNLQPGNFLYPIANQATVAYGFETGDGLVQPPLALQHWSMDHAMMMGGGAAPHPITSPSLPGSVEHWYPDIQTQLFAGCPYYPPQVTNSPNYNPLYYQKGTCVQQNAHPRGSTLFVPNPRTPTPPCLANGSTPTSQAPSPRSREPPPPPPERNQLNLSRIEDGQDTRTTVMIKNIPNKMSDRDLLNFIHKVCPRRIDFLYLRMDFSNGCNVGYAFVNFIHVRDLLTFAKKKLGEKWNMFSSEKVLQMSYANYQGKEALVEKFKNSCIMDEREAWRPKIFYSGGPEQGLPEPFPAPTHLRRKERSSHNRGALYVPGAGSGLQTQLYAQVGPRRQAQQNEEHRVRARDADNASPSAALTKRGRAPH